MWSAGVDAHRPFGTQRVVASAPFDDGDGNQAPDDGWRARTDNVGDASRSLTAYAVCADVNGLSYESEPFPVNADARAEDEAACPVGQYVIGGGVSQDGGFRKQRLVMTRYDMTSHASWEVQLDNLGTQSLDATAHAICHS